MNPGYTVKLKEMCLAAIFLLALCVTQPAFAQAPELSGGYIPAALAQKQAFVQGLVENASAAERFQASQDVEALSLVTLAKDNYASAVAGLKNGDFAGAEKQLNEVISRWLLLLSLRVHSPDSIALAIKQRIESKKLLESHEKLQGCIEFLEKPYRDYVRRARISNVAAALSEDAELTRFAERTAAVRMQIAMGRNDGALRALSNVAQLMRVAMNHILNSATVDYTMKFETPSDEYAYELERHRSYLELIPVAYIEFNPTEDKALIIGKLVKENYLAIEQAREYAGMQNYRRALAAVYAATGFLELALSTAGLVAPYLWLSPYDWQSWLDSEI